jgi:TIR domain
MTDLISNDHPQVFLSFAGPDRPRAERLREDLVARGFDAFVDKHSIEPAENLLTAINRALTRSSFCVLLWSQHTQNNPWVEVEWTAALYRDLNEMSRDIDDNRAFLFVARLDETDLPLLLATRKYLDATPGNWNAAVKTLVETWHRDRKIGMPVFPAPNRAAAGHSGDSDSIELYVRNRALSVSHVVTARSTVTGSELLGLVRNALDLRDSESKFGGIVSVRFEYELRHLDRALPDGSLADLSINDGDTVDLVVHCEFASQGRTISTYTYLDGPAPAQPAINPRVVRALINAAFGHLKP